MKEKGVEVGLQKEIAKSWFREDYAVTSDKVPEKSVIPLTKIKLVSAEGKREEEEKEVTTFLKSGMSFKLVPLTTERGRKGRSRDRGHSLDPALIEVPTLPLRSDSNEPRMSRELRIQRATRERLVHHSIRSVLYTNNIEKVMHEYRVFSMK